MTIIIKKYIRYVWWSGALQRRVPVFFAHHWVLCKMHVCPELSKSEMRTLRVMQRCVDVGISFHSYGSVNTFVCCTQPRLCEVKSAADKFRIISEKAHKLPSNFLRQRMQICASGLKFWMLRIDTWFGQCLRCTWADRVWTKVIKKFYMDGCLCLSI